MYTFRDLKGWLDTLTAKQLAEPVRWFGDEREGTIDGADTLKEDHVNLGAGIEPISAYAHDPDALDDAHERLPEGTPILLTDHPPKPGAT